MTGRVEGLLQHDDAARGGEIAVDAVMGLDSGEAVVGLNREGKVGFDFERLRLTRRSRRSRGNLQPLFFDGRCAHVRWLYNSTI